MKNIIVTTPKSEIENSRKEAEECAKVGGGFYFRKFKKCPKELESGSKIFYVEDGYIRGFGEVAKIVKNEKVCDVTRKNWGMAYFAIVPSCSWKWIKPIKMPGFQGFRYFDDENVEIVGNWLDPKPQIA